MPPFKSESKASAPSLTAGRASAPSEASQTHLLPKLLVRGRSFMALVVEPEAPLEGWFAALDQKTGCSASFFAGRPIVANLASVIDADDNPDAALEALDGLVARGIRVIGIEGIDPTPLAGTRWERLPLLSHGRDMKREPMPDPPPTARAPAPPAASLLIDRPVRSGQSIICKDGDVTVIGSIASGAEVIAGGSIHVYGALRGRAIAGLKTGGTARIFCRKLEAEMVAVDGLYRTAEHWGAELHGCAVQIERARGALRLTALG